MSGDPSVIHGRYQLERLIGRGGFAQVYLATDLLLKRRVAVKVLTPDRVDLSDEYDFLQRFEREAQAVAALDHPNILAVYDYGQVNGTAYLVTPYVEGGNLDGLLRREKRLELARTTGYLAQIAAALDYAHRRGIVHRDIKPQNMLLRAEDDRLLLADFGIAKVLSAASTSGQSLTGVMGTPTYMAPEQVQGKVGRTTDVYALGCVLFQMLTGEPPYAGPTEQVLFGHVWGPVPSVVERSQGRLPAALQPVLERALAKDPAARFQSAGELTRAVDAVLANPAPGPPPAPVVAPALHDQPTRNLGALPAAPPAVERPDVAPAPAPVPGGRLTTPRIIAVAAVVAVVALLALGTLAAALLTRASPTAPTSTPAIALGDAEPSPTPSAPGLAAPTRARPTPGAATTTAAGASAPSAVVQTIFFQSFATMSGHTDAIWQIAWSPDGKTLATASEDFTVRLWSAEGTLLTILTGHTDAVRALAWSPDGKVLASGSKDETARLWSADGQPVATLTGFGYTVAVVAWSPDGKTLATGAGDVRLWSADGKLLAKLTGHEEEVKALAWSPDGAILASGGTDYIVWLWDARGKALAKLQGHDNWISGLAWSPDGKTLASAGGGLRLWSAAGQALATLPGHADFVTSVAWSPDGKMLASGSDDKTVRLWTALGQPLATLNGHEGQVFQVGWSRDGATVGSVSYEDDTVRFWSVTGQEQGRLKIYGVTQIALSPAGDVLATCALDGTAQLWR